MFQWEQLCRLVRHDWLAAELASCGNLLLLLLLLRVCLLPC
jgi:hypothetical protein